MQGAEVTDPSLWKREGLQRASPFCHACGPNDPMMDGWTQGLPGRAVKTGNLIF